MALATLTQVATGHAPALVAALLHSLWQAALLATVCKGALVVVPCRRPNWRYTIALAGLTTVVVLFLVTLRLEMHQTQTAADTPTVLTETVNPNPAALADTPAPATLSSPPPSSPDWSTTPSAPPWQATAGLVWLAGVCLMVLRAARILHGETRATRAARPVDSPDVIALLDQLRAHLRVTRRVLLATVDAACSPAVVGVVSPTVLVPAAILTGSSPDHLRAILAHELAHIRRWDVLVNVLQLLVESLFFHNPFVWLLSAQIRHEREACCDAVAADCCGGAPAYARVLVDVGQRVLAASAAISFAHPNGLSDRVRRLLGLRPTGDTWRLPAVSLAIALLAGISTLLVIAQGTIKATDAVLSATERVELIEKTVTEQQKVLAVGTTRFVGTVETGDGRPLPKETTMILDTSQPGSSTRKALQVNGGNGRFDLEGNGATGRFDLEATGVTAMLWIHAPGYTPWFEGPMKPGKKAVTNLGLFVLEPQTPLVVRVRDEKGKAVANASVAPRWHPTGSSNSFYAGGQTTDANGECTIPLLTDFPMSLAIKAPAFEPATFGDLYPEPNKPLELRLKPSVPLVLRITDAGTGKPIAGAHVRELGVFGPRTSTNHQYKETRKLGMSGPDGVCSILGLHRDGAYWLLVEAAGHGTELVAGAVPGKQQSVELGPPRVLNGTITGDLTKLGMVRGKAIVEAWYAIRRDDCQYSNMYLRAPVRIENGVGTFRIDTLYEGSFRVSAGGVSKSVRVGKGETNVHFALDTKTTNPSANAQAREIRLALKPQPGLPLPRGTMKVRHSVPDERRFSHEDLPVINGVVTLQAPVGTRVEYSPGGLVGGWFAKDAVSAVPAGEGPLVVRIPFVPAGAIMVSVVDGKGRPTDGFLTNIQETKQSPLRSGSFLGVEGKSSSSSDDGIHACTATPLPLGGTYEIVVRRGYTCVSTGPIRLTKRHPLHKQKLALVGDATVHGRAVDPDGSPVSGLPINLKVRLAGNTFSGHEIRTDDTGAFEFPEVARHRNVNYSLSIDPRRGFAPQLVSVADLDRPLRIVVKPGLTVSGRLLRQEDDTLLCGYEVSLLRETQGGDWRFLRSRAEAPTDQKGNFRFSNLLPGTYRLSCDRINTPKPTRVKAGQTEPVIWRVPRPR